MPEFDLDFALRWLRRRGGTRSRRSDAELAFLEDTDASGAGLLLDTCVYIDQMRSATPQAVDAVLAGGRVFHSSVALQELAHSLGALDPSDPRTARATLAIRTRIRHMAHHRLRVPDADVLGRAALLAGLVCRLQGYARDDRLRALHDCVLFVQALKQGLTVLTADIGDFDVLAQLEPRGRVLYYRRG